MTQRKSLFKEWMHAPFETSASDELTEAQRALFERGYTRCADRARAAAAKTAGETNADDVVGWALVRLVHLVTRHEKRSPMPVDEDEFERRLIGLVFLIGKATVAGPRRHMPQHAFWPAAEAPRIPRPMGRPRTERLLTRDMDTIQDETALSQVDLGESDPEEKRLYFLQQMLIYVSYELGVVQINVLADHVEGVPREQSAARLGISVKTYDNTLARAKVRLREMLLTMELWEDVRSPVKSDWMETFQEMEERRVAALFRKKMKAKEKVPSALEGAEENVA